MSEYGDLINQSFGAPRQEAQTSVVGNIDESPDNAARAIDLSDATGVPPTVVHGDLENFERNHKAALAADIVKNNTFISDYVNSHPMAAKLSNDDYGQLDTVSSSVNRIGQKSVLGEALAGWQKGVGPGGVGSWIPTEDLTNHRLAASIYSVLGAPLEVPMRGISGLIQGVASGIGEAYAQATGHREGGEELKEMIPATADFLMLHAMSHPVFKGMDPAKYNAQLQKVMEASEAAKPYIEAGVEPPIGVHKVIDDLKKEQTRNDAKALDEALKEAQASKTRERNPEMFANFVRQHTDAKIGISADAVAELYGDKPPALDDGKLGWVPRIAEQLEMARETGGDIEVPMADWLAKVDPGLAKDLHDFVRVRPEGFNLYEMKGDSAPIEYKKAVESTKEMFHGSTREFDKFQGEMGWFTGDENVAKEYATNKLMGSNKAPVGEDKPTVYKVNVKPGRTLDLRNKEHQAVYEGLRESPNAEDSLPQLGSEGFVQPSGLPSFGNATEILRRAKDFDSVLVDEGTHGQSLLVRDPANRANIVKSTNAVGHVVQTLRDSSKLDPALLPDDFEALDYGAGITAYIKKDDYTAKEAEIQKAVEDELARLTPKQVATQSAHKISTPEVDATRGMHITYDSRTPVILYSLTADDPVGVARHEAIHHLRQQGFFTNDEWSMLMHAAVDGEWLKKHDINTRYKGLGSAAKIEEAIADEFADWKRTGKAEGPIGKVFERLKALIEGIRRKLREVLGKEPTADDIFEKVESGEVGQREGNAPRLEGAYREAKDKQGELDVTRMEDRDVFAKASAIGMTLEQYRRYMSLIEKRRAEDAEANLKRVEADEAKRQTKEWKANRVDLRKEVAADLRQRPDILADEFLREHKTSIDNVDTDALAGFFGYQSGFEMESRVRELENARTKANMNPSSFLELLINNETDRRMEAKYGNLADNILADAKDQVLSDTQLDLIHEEVLALAEQAGAQLPLPKDSLKAWVKDQFEKIPIGDVSVDSYLRDAGRAGREAELALLKGDFAEAFRQKQRQFLAVTTATEAKKLEKLRDQFDTTAKRLSAREVPSIDQEYTNWIHDVLSRVGKPIRRSVQDLTESLSRSEQKTLGDFVDFKEFHDMRELPVAEFLLDPSYRKSFDSLSVSEFKAVADSIKALAKNGRDEKKITKQGEEADLAEVKGRMIEELQTFQEKNYDASGGRWLGPIPPAVARPLRTYLVSHLQLESIFNRWDRGDPRGVFTSYIARELASAANYEAALERKYSRALGEVADKADLNKPVLNRIFKDPLSHDANFIPFTRKNLRAVLLNMGNESNLTKLARGYKLQPQMIVDWAHQLATKEDWQWAQKVGDIFAEIKKEADVMYRGLSGIEPESIDIKPIDTPHGKQKGWYYPVVYHPVWEGASKKLMGGDALEQDNYVRATTPRGYTKQRTGYAAPLSLDMDMMPVRMRQMLHDIAFRPQVINAGKIFYDKDVRSAITQHYGVEYRNQLVPYLRDVANASNYRSDAQKVGVQVSEFIRQNIIATLIGLNPGTVLKHGPTAAINSLTEVGALNFLRAVKGLTSINEATGESNWSFAMKTSEELQRRHRHYQETLGGATEKVMGEQSLRDMVIKYGSYPVAISDLLSATPTWLAQYERSMREGSDHGEAVSLADRAVRRAHGSSVITNRPSVMRGGALMSWMTSVYGFFNHIMNRQYELMWKAGDTLDLAKRGEYKEAMKQTPALTGMLFSYVILPALIEEMVTPLATDDHESWGKKAAKGIGYTVSASWIGIRDLASAILRGTDPSIGLLSTGFKTISDLGRDFNKDKPLSKQHAGQVIQHGATAFGALTGLTNAQEGKTARFIYSYATGQERPKGPWGWMVGSRYGTMKNHSRTFDDFLKGKVQK